jgi:hypothetical protein
MRYNTVNPNLIKLQYIHKGIREEGDLYEKAEGIFSNLHGGSNDCTVCGLL